METSLPLATTATLERSPLVEAVYPQITLDIEGTMIAGNTFFDCLFVFEEHALDLLEFYQLEIKEGRLPRRNTAEIAMSEELARNRGLKVGDEFSRNLVVDSNEEKIFTLVGILQGKTQLTLGSYDFARRTLLPLGLAAGIIVIPTNPAQEGILRSFLNQTLKTDDVEIISYQDVVQQVTAGATMMEWIMSVIVMILAVVISSTTGLISILHFNQRLTEFGILAALGYGKGRLVIRTINETIALVVVSWTLGVLVSYLVLFVLSNLVFAPQGLLIKIISGPPLLYSTIAPMAMTLLSITPVTLNLFRLDPVTIVERRI